MMSSESRYSKGYHGLQDAALLNLQVVTTGDNINANATLSVITVITTRFQIQQICPTQGLHLAGLLPDLRPKRIEVPMPTAAGHQSD